MVDKVSAVDEFPMTIELKDKMLPCVEEWDVGEKHKVMVEIEVVTKNKGGLYNGDDKGTRITGKVLGAEDGGMEPDEGANDDDTAEGETNQVPQEKSGAFIRQAAKVAGEKIAESLVGKANPPKNQGPWIAE